MAALVTLTDAKRRLRVDTDDENTDIYAMVIEASDIVLDYLKARPIAIASISVANPTVITTSVPHSLTSGDSAPITGTTTTPTVNGAQTVTVTSPTTFTVPVNVTVGQSTAAGTVGRPAWTDLTAPKVVRAAVLEVLEALHEHNSINWDQLGLVLCRQRDPALA